MAHLFIIAVLVSLSLVDRWADGIMPAGTPPLLMVVIILAPYAVLGSLGALGTRLCVRVLDRTGRASAVRWSSRVVLAVRLLGVLWHLVTVPVLGVLGLVRSVTGDLILIDELLAAVPAFALLLWTVRLAHPIESRIRAATLIADLDRGRPVYPFPGPWTYVVSTARNTLAIIAVPLTLILGWAEALDWIARTTRFTDSLGLGLEGSLILMSGLQIVGALVIFAAVPVLMVRVWDTVPIPPGELRDDLERLARAHRVRVSGFLIWRTHGAMLNGAVIGLTPLTRFIVLTDALLDSLPEPEVEAVAAHEVAHVKRRHMVWLTLAILGSAMVSGELTAMLVGALLSGKALGPITGGVVSVAVVIWVLGAVSRRFEWQADAFAARHLSEAHEVVPVITHEAAQAMSGALARVARLNGMPQSKFTWRHGSIATRRRRLEALIGRPVGSLPIDRQVRRVLWGSALVFVAGVALTAFNSL